MLARFLYPFYLSRFRWLLYFQSGHEETRESSELQVQLIHGLSLIKFGRRIVQFTTMFVLGESKLRKKTSTFFNDPFHHKGNLTLAEICLECVNI